MHLRACLVTGGLAGGLTNYAEMSRATATPRCWSGETGARTAAQQEQGNGDESVESGEVLAERAGAEEHRWCVTRMTRAGGDSYFYGIARFR